MNILPISVLIPTLNRPKSLENTIKSFLSGSHFPSEIVIVDQSDTDDTLAVCNAFSNILKDVKIVYLKSSVKSSTISRNMAINASSNDILIFSDDDIEVNADTLYNVFKLMSDKNMALLAGIDLNTFGKSSKKGHILRYVAGFCSHKYRNQGHVTASILGCYPDYFESEVDTQWAMGYFFSVKKSLLDKWKISWDENLRGYAYAEDLDFSYRYCLCASLEKLKCKLNRKVEVRHLTSTEFRIPREKHVFKYVINRDYLSYKWNKKFSSRLAARRTNFVMFLIMAVKRGHPSYYVKAQLLCDKNRSKIKNGNLEFLD